MEGDKLESFKNMYNTVFPVLIRIAYHISGDMEVSEDLCQEAFIRYYRRGIPFPTTNQAKYWLIRVVKNLSLNYIKKKTREKRAYNIIARDSNQSAESGETLLINDEINRNVKAAIIKLPYNLRTAIVLREYGGLNYKEIAKILRITEGNVKVRIYRARTCLKNVLEEEKVYVSE